ncbi:MAG: asparagine synthase (glutamine-hydrolyzing) [Bacteroidetes bacterium]|nr:asparagine synthase (glutamine-hydrolyzing) [Bacteroidota bacterium]
MCGIAGIWHLDGTSLPNGKLENFTDSILERGPDGSGYDYFENNTLGLGHRRLSILDLSEAGHQPMYFANRRYAITYNGEVFNFEEIRAELEALGHHFESQTDTEVVLAAYAHWGERCLTKFNGMWAFAIWDNQEKTLFMARDRFGIKPFYYTYVPGSILAFASETRAFKKLQDYQRSLDENLVKLHVQGVRIHGSGNSIYKNIFQILPGHYMKYRSGGELNQKRWWNIADYIRKDIPKTLEEQAEEFYSIFRDACRLRLISDVSVGTALSGGLDSSSVYSVVFDLLQKEHLHRVHANSQQAFVATFPGLLADERHYAEEAISFTGGPAVFLDQNYGNLRERIIQDTLKFDALLNGPITSVSGIYAGMKKAGITVSMDGHGVDEMLYGYRDMIYNLFYYFYNKGDYKQSKMIQDVLIPTYHEVEQDAAMANINRLTKLASNPLMKLKAVIRRVVKGNPFDGDAYINHDSLVQLGEPYDFSGMNYVDRMVYQETFVDTLPAIFRDFDRAGMMNSVEIRMPFMDWRLVRYIFSLPFSSKINGEFNKLILRESMKGKMAEGIRTRKHKIGIGSPVEHWFQTELQEWVQDFFHSTSYTKNRIITDKDFAEKLDEGYRNKNLDKNTIHIAWQEMNLHIITD